ncbi:MAG: DUF4838 domain-containing protein [Victivallales bacterium]|nr:DUF4838 domain-containing protein [Victivallales bacterium]
MSKSFFIALFFLTGAFLLTAAPSGRFEPKPQGPRYCKTDTTKSQLLFEDGKLNFEIVYGESSGAMQAASELAVVLEKALGVKPPVRKAKSGNIPALIVGDKEAAIAAGFDPDQLEWGAFQIKTSGNDIIIAGRDQPPYSEGTFYAVDEFLERFVGVRFYFPGNVGTIIPKLKKWSVPAIDLADRPDMQTRTSYSVDPFVNNFHGSGPIRWYEDNPKNNAHILAKKRYRIQIRSPFQACHGLAYLSLIERFGKTHPEYFALNQQGIRELGFGTTSRQYGHVCFSSEELKNELVLDGKAILTGKDGSTRGAFKKDGKPAWPSGNQNYGFFNVMPNDSACLCQCPKCKPHFAGVTWNKPASKEAGNLTWTFMTDIARRLKNDNVPGYVLTMAYSHYVQVPDVDIPDNMLVMLALFGPWADLTPNKVKQINLLKQWREKLGAKPYIWNYATKYTARIPLVPNWTPRAFGRYYHEVSNDIFGAFLECETDYWIFGYMNYYIFGKLMWNKDSDAEAILDEHYKLMYGAAAPEMTRFFDIIEDIWMHEIVGRVVDSPEGPVSVRPSKYMLWNQLYSPEVRKELDSLLKKAIEKCANEPEATPRIAFMRREFYDRILEGAALYEKSTAEVEEWKGYMPTLKEGEKLIIDGNGDEQAWKDAPAHFLLPNHTVKSEAVEVRTNFKALQDTDNFYFFIECEEPETDRMTAIERKPDEFNLWEDNTIEVFFNPSGDRETGYQLMFNSAGYLSDNTFKLKVVNWKWNSEVEYKISVTQGEKWCIEMRIPKKNMETCKDKLIANVMRSRVVDGKRDPFQTWSPKIQSSQHIECYGTLYFTPPAEQSILPGGDFTEKTVSRRFLGNHRPHQWYNGSFLFQDTKIFRTGGMSIRMNDETEGFTFYDLRPFLNPDTSYRLSFYIKTQDITSLTTWGGGVYVTVDCGMKPRETIHFPMNNGKFTGTMPWTRQTFEFKTPKDFARDERPYLSFTRRSKYNGKEGIAWIDNVELFEIPEEGK